MAETAARFSVCPDPGGDPDACGGLACSWERLLVYGDTGRLATVSRAECPRVADDSGGKGEIVAASRVVRKRCRSAAMRNIPDEELLPRCSTKGSIAFPDTTRCTSTTPGSSRRAGVATTQRRMRSSSHRSLRRPIPKARCCMPASIGSSIGTAAAIPDSSPNHRSAWPRMRTGFELLMKRFPSGAWNQANFTMFACRVGRRRDVLEVAPVGGRYPVPRRRRRPAYSLEICDARFHGEDLAVARSRCGPSSGDRVDAQMPQRAIELTRKNLERLLHPSLPTRRQPIERRATEHHCIGAQCERLRNVGATTKAAINDDTHLCCRQQAEISGTISKRRDTVVELPPAVIGENHPIAAH